MFTRLGFAFIAALFLSAAGSPAYAGEFAIETDPLPFALKGYAVHGFYRPDALPQFRFGVGTYALDLPSQFIDMDPKNTGEGWTASIKGAASAFVEWYPGHKGNGYFAGVQLATQGYRVEKGGVNASFTNGIAMFQGGYLWYLKGERGFYLKPWAGVGYQTKIEGNTCVGKNCYDVLPVVGFVTLHVGYEF